MLESKSRAATLSVAALALGLATPALADPSPNGPGQPGVLLTGGTACGDSNTTSSPAGFNGSGFTGATLVYAGSTDTPSLNGNQTHAISQYDIACFQQTQQGH